MKKIISILIVSLLMLQGVALASYQLGTEEDALILSGTGVPNATVSLMLLNSDHLECEDAESTLKKYYSVIEKGEEMTTDTIFYYITAEVSDAGSWEVSVPMTDIDRIDLTFISNLGDCEYIQYASVSFRTNMIPVLKENANVDDEFVSLSESMTYYIDFITDSPAMYKSLADKTYVAQFCAETIKGLSEDSESLALLKQVMNKAIYLAAVSEGKIDDFEDVVYFDYDTEAISSAKSECKNRIVELLQGKKFLTEKDYINEVKVQIALQSFNYSSNRSSDYLLDALNNRNDVLELDLSEFEDLSKSKQTKAAKKLADKKAESVEDMQDFLDDIVDDLAKESSSGGGGGGFGSGNGSSSGSGTYAGSTTPSISEEYIQEQKYVYPDMSLAPWAADAVLYLSQKSIVNGYNDGSFKPLNEITRAEFTKIVTEAFYGLSSDASGETPFTDVDSSQWYAPYIAKAYTEGIVSGKANGTFAPNDKISRQDMAVILYNASVKHNLISEVTQYAPFGDDSGISGYARAAVYTLSDADIINGVGDNLFAPESNANRASAAQMLYGIMTKLNK